MGNSTVEKLIQQVFDRLPGSVDKAIGRRETSAWATAYRVVAIPLGAPEITGADRIGDAKYVDAGRILLRRWFDIRWECHAAPTDGVDDQRAPDFGPSEALYIDVLKACRFCFHNSVRFSAELWEDQQEDRDGLTRYGSVISFTSTIDIPVYEKRGGLTTLTADPPIVTTAKLNEETA